MAVLLALTGSQQARAGFIVFSQGLAPTPGYEHLGSQIWGEGVNTNSGAETVMRIGRARGGGAPLGVLGPMRTVLAFDLSAIPAGSTITGVMLTLTIDSTVGSPGLVELHRIVGSQPMIEGTGTITASNDGVTWGQIRPGVPWATPGGDFLPAVLSAIPAGTGVPGDLRVFASSPLFVGAAQSAFAAGSPLELILLSPAVEAQAGSVENFWRFASDDSATAAFRPRLAVEFTPAVVAVPEPSSLVLLATGACGLAAFRHRRRLAQ